MRIPAESPSRCAVTAEYSAEYSVNGGPPQGLPSVRRTYGSDFQVQEIQPVLVQRR